MSPLERARAALRPPICTAWVDDDVPPCGEVATETNFDGEPRCPEHFADDSWDGFTAEDQAAFFRSLARTERP